MVIISLNIPDELAISRMASRAGVPESAAHNFKKYLHGYEAVAEDEPNTYEINIHADMRPHDVCSLILRTLEKYKKDVFIYAFNAAIVYIYYTRTHVRIYIL